MNTRTRFGVALALVGLAGLVSVLAAPELPARLVTNWDGAGNPNGTMSRTAALALTPLLGLFLVGLFALVPRIDPLRENIASFRVYYDWLVVLFSGFVLLLHVGVVAFNLGYVFDMTLLVLVAEAGLFYYIGVILGHAKRNWFVGVRTPWTLSSDEVWDRTHALAGRLFKLTAVLTLVGLAFGEYALLFLLVPALLTAVVTVGYSYWLYARLEREGNLDNGGDGERQGPAPKTQN